MLELGGAALTALPSSEDSPLGAVLTEPCWSQGQCGRYILHIRFTYYTVHGT